MSHVDQAYFARAALGIAWLLVLRAAAWVDAENRRAGDIPQSFFELRPRHVFPPIAVMLTVFPAITLGAAAFHF
jgi:hypothetical protein